MAKKKSSTEFTRVNINVPVHIVEKVKAYADELGINATSAYIVLLNQALTQKDSFDMLPAIVSLLGDYKNQKSDLKIDSVN